MSELRTVTPTTPAEQIARIVNEDGGVIVDRVIPGKVIDELFGILAPDLDAAEVDTRNLYGRAKRGVRDLFMRSSRFIDVVLLNQPMQDVNKLVLQSGGHHHRLSSEGAGEILKGGKDQFLHREIDSFPHLAYSPDMPDFICFNLIAGSDFRRENGATRVVPGSHRWAVDRDVSSIRRDEIAYAEMAKGMA
jgi:ectoine hydroxylase-related dioxygenase (phytanoyl-CoA dioxygenase family)